MWSGTRRSIDFIAYSFHEADFSRILTSGPPESGVRGRLSKITKLDFRKYEHTGVLRVTEGARPTPPLEVAVRARGGGGRGEGRRWQGRGRVVVAMVMLAAIGEMARVVMEVLEERAISRTGSGGDDGRIRCSWWW